MEKLQHLWITFTGVEPFEHVKADCPICGAVGEQRKIKKHLVSEKDHEVDLYPRHFSWSLKYLEWCHPPLYYMWGCRDCGFTAADVDYENPGRSHSINPTQFRRAMLRSMQRPEAKSLTAILQHGNFEEPARTFSSACGATLLSLYLHEGIAEVVHDEPLVLAQYYHRMGWLYRDLAQGFPLDKDAVAALVAKTAVLWPSVPLDERACMIRSAELFELGLSSASSIQTIRDEIELIILIARMWMKIGDSRKAKNLGVYCRERLSHYESCLEQRESQLSPEEMREIQELVSMESDISTMLAEQ